MDKKPKRKWAFITVGVSFPDCDKASGGMRTDLQRKVAKATANLAPIPLGAELNMDNDLKDGRETKL